MRQVFEAESPGAAPKLRRSFPWDSGPHLSFIQWSVVTAAAILLVLPFRTFAEFPPTVVVWVTAGTLFLLAFHGFRAVNLRGESPWLAPLSLVMVFYFIKYGLGAIVIYYWSQFPWEVFPHIGATFERYGIQDNLANACQLFLLGGLGLYLGVGLSAQRVSEWLPSLHWQVDRSKFNLNLILYTPIALFIFIVLRSYLPITVRHTVLLFGWIVWVFIVIISYRLFSLSFVASLKWLVFLGLIFAALFPLFLWTGMREHALKPVLMVVLGYIMARGRIPWKLVIPAFALVFLILSPWLSFYKLQGSAGQSISERITGTNAEFIETPLQGHFEIAVSGLVGRLVGTTASFPPVYSQYYPEVYPFESGRSFLTELSGLVPRILWPDKPNISLELNRYTVAVGMLPVPDETSAVFDAISEYYINFGTLGVFLFSLLHGYYFKVLYEWLVRRSIYEIGASIYIVLFFLNHDFFGVVEIFTAQTRQLVVWPFLLYIMSRKS